MDVLSLAHCTWIDRPLDDSLGGDGGTGHGLALCAWQTEAWFLYVYVEGIHSTRRVKSFGGLGC